MWLVSPALDDLNNAMLATVLFVVRLGMLGRIEDCLAVGPLYPDRVVETSYFVFDDKGILYFRTLMTINSKSNLTWGSAYMIR
jgi:hypothetical protein